MRDIIRADAERRFADTWTRPVGAWLAACLASGAAMFGTFGVMGLAEGVPSAQEVAGFAAAIIPGTLYIGVFMVVLTALPTLAFAWLMHSQGWKKIYTSALFGGLTGAGVLQLFGFPIRHGAEAIPVTMMFFCVGLVGGSVYRLVAGKH
jgi:hypothetical protein